MIEKVMARHGITEKELDEISADAWKELGDLKEETDEPVERQCDNLDSKKIK